ncbi:MAG: TPM domain-containing protein [Bacteroidetes bacterium]|nr:TPM domain-containing protein [Bacteroidota bacterium]
MKAEILFSEEQKKEIVQAIESAELNTSGEVRVHIENTCGKSVLDRAAYIFKELEMHKTALRNGVLFYLSIKDKKFAILGDAGINAKVPADFWNVVKDVVIKNFKEEKFTEGLVQGISLAGEKLKEHFPYQNNDKNELANEVSFS